MSFFKICTCCKSPWSTRDDFLQDTKIKLIGYQANFCHLELGYLLFNHLSCESTIAIHAGLFKDLYNGPVFTQRLTGSEPCPGYCEHIEVLEPCEKQCECAYIREIMQVVRTWPHASYQLANIAHG